MPLPWLFFFEEPVFDTLKLYTRKEIPQEEVQAKLIEFGYRRVDETIEEGDFSIRGDCLELFPTNFNFPLRIEWQFNLIDKLYSFDKTLNKRLLDYDFIIILPARKKIRRYDSEDLPLETALRIERGDYVVHTRYGIGRFRGMKRLKVKDTEDYYFELEYDNNDKLYVPKEEAHLIQKYISFTARLPRLSRLGSREWLRTKERVASGIKEFALELLRMEAQRKVMGGFKYSVDSEWQKMFEIGFPYRETEDQLKATRQVKADMESKECMDRVVCGDVGYGKTEVAMRAAFKAVMDLKQVGFLVPTTILAYQHYTNLSKRLKPFPINLEMLSRFRSRLKQTKLLKDLREGRLDIVVGTHRLLSDDVLFKDLGLLIIDEEHKFGVKHKEKIKKLKVGIDVLTLTATPIPRTLYMSLIGLKNISLIKTPPKDRLAVKTKIVEFSQALIKEAIMREVSRQGQVFFIHNRIETIQRIYKILRGILPDYVRIAAVHAQLPAHKIESVMLDFIEKRLDCLICTAIVESGIDIPQANTIIINDAHTFGLADLHQLRGRVGRLDVQAYAYMVIPHIHIAEAALKRLRMIEEFSHLGAGFEVAMSDLELRGAGNILGSQQHGFVWMVGFDLYCRLLKKEIEYLREAFKIGVK